ncbi:hypothetical protein Tco_0514313 [Tanacetum coccineum]
MNINTAANDINLKDLNLLLHYETLILTTTNHYYTSNPAFQQLKLLIIDQPSTSSKPKKKQPSKKSQRQEAEVSQDETEHEESVPTPSNDPQPSGEDSMQLTDLMVLCTKWQTQVLDLEKAKDAQEKEIAALKKRI